MCGAFECVACPCLASARVRACVHACVCFHPVWPISKLPLPEIEIAIAYIEIAIAGVQSYCLKSIRGCERCTLVQTRAQAKLQADGYIIISSIISMVVIMIDMIIIIIISSIIIIINVTIIIITIICIVSNGYNNITCPDVRPVPIMRGPPTRCAAPLSFMTKSTTSM